ncbi:MAG: peroxide stress protein YaaA [Prolixibacteraceae bacterium]
MLAILSPAKDMKVLPQSEKATNQFTIPEFLNKSSGIITDLKKLKPTELSAIMKISEKLAVQNYDRYRNWHKEHAPEYSAPAILSFTGEAYRGLRAGEFNRQELEYSQSVLRILSGLYGLIRPLDLIQEHRLEMGTRHSFRGKKNLYELWKTTLTKTIDKAVFESPGDRVLINVASNEYSSAIDFKSLKSRVVSTSFYQENNGEINMVAVYAKRARGMMARFIIENQLEKVDELKAFDAEGYYFDSQRSTQDNWLFLR